MQHHRNYQKQSIEAHTGPNQARERANKGLLEPIKIYFGVINDGFTRTIRVGKMSYTRKPDTSFWRVKTA